MNKLLITWNIILTVLLIAGAVVIWNLAAFHNARRLEVEEELAAIDAGLTAISTEFAILDEIFTAVDADFTTIFAGIDFAMERIDIIEGYLMR